MPAMVVVVQQGSILWSMLFHEPRFQHYIRSMSITIQIDVNHVHVSLKTTVTPERNWKTNI